MLEPRSLMVEHVEPLFFTITKKTLVFDFGTFVEKGDFDWAVWHADGTWSRDDVHPFHGPTSAAGSLLPGPQEEGIAGLDVRRAL